MASGTQSLCVGSDWAERSHPKRLNGDFQHSKVFVVDDEETIRTSLGRLFRAEGVPAELLPSAQEFLVRPPHQGPSCLVLDLQMPGIDGLALQKFLSNGEAQVVFLTGHGSIDTCASAMKSGAVDFLTKPVEAEELLAAVARALAKSCQVREQNRARRSAEEKLQSLTPREFQVMERVLSGMLNKQIAADIGAAEKTVKIHRGRVMKKMAVSSVAELVRVAHSAGCPARSFNLITGGVS